MDCTGHIPMDRRCVTAVYGHAMKARGAVLLIPGFASNRAVFDMGGGKGGDGPSFFEYLAKRGYDTYSIDLRGSRNALSLGSKPPAFLKEHVEVDVPSAIKFIKCIGPYEKVYLIGHSMGGAISCAVAGHVPDEVAGIVHLAGLYHYTIPYMHDFSRLLPRSMPPIRPQRYTHWRWHGYPFRRLHSLSRHLLPPSFPQPPIDSRH
ncbi:Alpha/Beta hydrolase protein [Chytridium lagenaria]|nr:Alpha/Beta hydrolase protein [Chytridium lagenaria]